MCRLGARPARLTLLFSPGDRCRLYLWCCPVFSDANMLASNISPGVRHRCMPLEWAVGFFFGNTELSLELWNIISGISGFDD